MDLISSISPLHFLFQSGTLLYFTEIAAIDSFDTNILLFQIGVVVLGLLFSALFSGSEVAFFSLGHKMKNDRDFNVADKSISRIITMLSTPRRLLATILICNTFSNIITAVMAAVITGSLLIFIGIPEVIVYTIEVIILTFLILILSEITPKILALKDPLSVAKKLSGFIYFFYIILTPLSKIIATNTIWLEAKLPKPTDRISSDDLKTIAEMGEVHGSLREDEREIIENVIEFGNTTVKEIMTSRVNIVAIDTEDSLGEVMALIREKSVSRMPLCKNDLDNILGIIHTKDLLPFIKQADQSKPIKWEEIARKPLFIPVTKKLDDLLKDFQAEKTHMAVVVDEYGGTEGIVSLDDVLEEIIGDLNDEYSGQELLYTRRKSGDYIFDAKIDLDDMGDILNIEITTDDDEYETLGGLIYHLLERIPEIGEEVVFSTLILQVHKVENNRVTKVRVRVQDQDQKPENIEPEKSIKKIIKKNS